MNDAAGTPPRAEPPWLLAALQPRRPATDAEARALGSALRLRILRLCLDEALTNKEIADRLGRPPASVLHHVRRLVDTGFLASMPVRRGTRGAREVPYRATGKSWFVHVADAKLRNPAPETAAMLDAFLAELAEAGGAAAIDDMTRLGLRLREPDREELSRRLQEVFDDFAGRVPDPAGEPWSLFFALHRDARGRRRRPI